jgi:hypothetical protein
MYQEAEQHQSQKGLTTMSELIASANGSLTSDEAKAKDLLYQGTKAITTLHSQAVSNDDISNNSYLKYSFALNAHLSNEGILDALNLYLEAARGTLEEMAAA